MISGQDPQNILHPKVKITSQNCTSSHGGAGFLEGTVYDKTLGVFVCPCGKQYTSKIEKPSWIPTTSQL